MGVCSGKNEQALIAANKLASTMNVIQASIQCFPYSPSQSQTSTQKTTDFPELCEESNQE